MYIYICIYIYVYIYICIHVCMYVCMQLSFYCKDTSLLKSIVMRNNYLQLNISYDVRI